MKRSALNRVSRTPAARLRRDLDVLWRQCITKLFKGRCAKCGCEGTDCHHLIKRRNKHTRWDVMNGLLLCTSCHWLAENEPTMFSVWLILYRPDHSDWITNREREESGTVLVSEMQDTKADLKALLGRLA